MALSDLLVLTRTCPQYSVEWLGFLSVELPAQISSQSGGKADYFVRLPHIDLAGTIESSG